MFEVKTLKNPVLMHMRSSINDRRCLDGTDMAVSRNLPSVENDEAQRVLDQ